MSSLRNGLILLLSIVAGFAADNESDSFKPGPASSYPNHQTISQLTIGAEAFNSRDKTRAAFGKLDPKKYGVLPVMVVMENDSDQTLRLDQARVEYIRPDRRRIEAIPAEEVKYLDAPKRPNMTPKPYPTSIPGLGGKPKQSPLAAWEIEGRAFAAKMLPPRDKAHGFFYFNTADHRGATLYITGIVEAATGKELFFFEIPLD